MVRLDFLVKSKLLIDTNFGSNFPTLGTRLAFGMKLRQVFIKVSIIHHFDPKYHIQIKIDILGYIIGRVLR